MPRPCCARVVDALCPCFRRRSLSSASGGVLGNPYLSVNLVLHGECEVGKTSLRNRWVDGIFTGDVAPTIGVDFNIKTLDLVQEVEDEDEDEEGELSEAPAENPSRVAAKGGLPKKRRAPFEDLQVKINVYDTSGKPGYRDVNSTYLLAFDAVLFVYDISSMASLNELRRYFSDPEHRDKLATKKRSGMAMLLVGNKCDVPLSQRQVGSQTGQETAAEFGMPFVEVSAKTGASVREAFMFVTTRAVTERLARERLKGSTSRSGNKSVNTTMQSVPGLKRALRARASVMDVFKGMAGRREHLRHEHGSESLKPEEANENGVHERRGHPQPPRWSPEETGGAGWGQSGERTTGAASTRRGIRPRKFSSRADYLSPHRAVTAANSPVAQSGSADGPTASLSKRPTTQKSMPERESTAFGSSSCTPQLDTSGEPFDSQVSRLAARATDTPGGRRQGPWLGQRRNPPGSGPTSTHTPSPPTPSSLRSASPATTAASARRPRGLLNPSQARVDPAVPGGERPAVAAGGAAARGYGQLTHAGCGSEGADPKTEEYTSPPSAPAAAAVEDEEDDILLKGRLRRASPERTAGSVSQATMVEDSAATKLRETSSFWLRKWGIKAAKTDATRGRHSVIRGSHPPSPRYGSGTGSQ